MRLRKGQKELVELYKGGYCAVPAIPGGGKTHCLSLWAVEMITNGLIKPGKILIVTYMNSAVNNFKQRISGELSKRGIIGSKDYFVSTIHGLCLNIIKEKPDAILADEEFEVLDGVEKVRLVSASVDEWKRDNDDKFRLYLDESYLSSNKIADTYKKWHDKFCGVVVSSIGEFKSYGMDVKDAKRHVQALSDDSILKWCADIYGIYDTKLKRHGFFDFDDLLYNAKKMLLEDENLLKKYQDKYVFVCEDEAQDSNQIQNDILTLIANGNFLRVGDSNQAICGSFTSSDFELFKLFCKRDETTVYNITQSSRNTEDIINLANYFVDFVRDKHPIEECRESLIPQHIEVVGKEDICKNPITSKYGIRVFVGDSWKDEVEKIVMEIEKFIKEYPDKTIAVLVPTAWRMSELINKLELKKVPFEQLDNTSGERNKIVKLLGRVINFVAEPENGEKFWYFVDECLLRDDYDNISTDDGENIVQRDLLSKFLRSYPTEKILYPMGGEIDFAKISKNLLSTQIWKDFFQYLDLVREILEFPLIVVEKLILYISEKFNFNEEERAIAQKIAGDVRYLMNKDPNWRLSDLALELLSPKNMFNYFAGVVWELKGYAPKEGVVTVSTYHKSKGLEWDCVFLTSLNNSDFPVNLEDKFQGEYWFLKNQYKNPGSLAKSQMQSLIGKELNGDMIKSAKIETISERTRLLYVGITRAKEYLFLSGFHENIGKKNEVQPSRYLIELGKYIEEEIKRDEGHQE